MTETEVERLVVRLMGDSSHFTATIDKAVKDAVQATRTVEREARSNEASVRRAQATQAKAEREAERNARRATDNDIRELRRLDREAATLRRQKEAEERKSDSFIRNLQAEHARVVKEQARETARAAKEASRAQVQAEADARRADKARMTPPKYITPPPIPKPAEPPVQERFIQNQIRRKQILVETARAQAMHSRAMAEGQSLLLSTRTPLEQYNISIARAGQLLQQGAFTQRQHAEYVQRTTQAYRDSLKSITDYSSELRNAGLVIAGLAAGVTTAFTAMILSSVRAAGEFTQMRIAFETMLGSAAEAKRTINDIIDFAVKTPFTLHQVEAASRTMITFGETGHQLMDTMEFLGNAASATGTDFGLVALVFNQIRGVGHLLMQDFRQLAIRGILSMADLAKFYKVTTAEAQRMMTAQQISFEDVRAILRGLSDEGGRFAGMNEKLAKEMLGLWSNLADSVSILGRQIGQQLEPTVKSLLSTLLSMTDTLRAASDTTLVLVASTLVLGAGSAGLIGMLGTGIFVFGQLTITAKALKGAYDALSASGTILKFTTMGAKAGIVALAAVLITALSVALYKANGDVQDFNRSMQETIRLSDEVARRQQKDNAEVIRQANDPKMSTKDREAFIAEQIRLTDSNLNALKGRIAYAQAEADRLEPSILSAWQAGRDVWEAQLQQVTELEAAYAAMREQMQSLRQVEAANVGKPSEAQEDALKTLEKWRVAVQAFGLSSREAAIYEMSLHEVETATLNLLMAEDRRLTELEKQQEITEYIRDYNNEVTKSANVLGLTAVQAKVLEAALMGASVAQQEIVRNIALFEEGQKLIEKYRPPIEAYRRQMEVINELLNAGAIDQHTFDKAMQEAEKELLDKELDKAITFHVEGMDAVRKGTKEYFDILNAVEKRRATKQVLDEANKIPNRQPAPGTPEVYKKGETDDKQMASSERRNKLLERIASATEAANRKPTIQLTGLGLS